jgi:hypothetical protein
MNRKKRAFIAGALIWLVLGGLSGLALDAHKPPQPPPYDLVRFTDSARGPALNKSDDQRVVCVSLPSGGKMCFAHSTSDADAMAAVEAHLADDKAITRAFWGVFTLVPPAFIFLVLALIWGSGGQPAGFKRLEEENFQPKRPGNP